MPLPPFDGKFVLRRVEETDLRYHRVYKVKKRLNEITSADNLFASEPLSFVSKAMYVTTEALPFDSWYVKLADIEGKVLMGVFQLRSKR